jgi:tyrosinase
MIDRRMMLATGLAAAGTMAAGEAAAQTLRRRVSWQAFRTSTSGPSYARAVAIMRGNPNASDPNSWFYWANIHQNFCPHGVPYFLAWHRGYILQFEQKIRELSRDPNFSLPYWNYFADPNIPSEFTNPAPGNPLYVQRTNTNVVNALGYDFTDPVWKQLPRNWPTPMEPRVESVPHNQVHNIIGGYMPTLQSPQDPIFWLHHANIDRLWCAWVKAGAGRANPAPADAYWNGTFVYGGQPQMNKRATYSAEGLGYMYDDERLPTPRRARAAVAPPVRAAPLARERMIGQVLSLGETQGGLTLDRSSFSLRVPLGADGQNRTRLLTAPPPRGPAAAAARPPVAINVVLEDVAVTEAGRKGGYFYQVYVNLPAGGALDPSRLIGTVGPFEIAGAQHGGGADGPHAAHGDGKVRLVLPATEALRRLPPGQLREVKVSFVRVDGPESPSGPAITIGAFRVESTVEAPR